MNSGANISFSVIVPVYNAEPYLERCVRSVLAQTHGNFEAIFVDDGSTDNGVRIIEKVKDIRIRLIRQTNQGVSAARNRAISVCRNEFIAFLDADDEWFPNHLETLAELVAFCSEAAMYSTGYQLQEQDGSWPTDICVRSQTGEPISANDPFPFWTVCQINHCSNTAVSKKILQKTGCFVKGVAENEDLDLWIRIASLHRSIIYSPKITSIVHKTPPDGKPRFKKRPDSILACKTALRHLAHLSRHSGIMKGSVQRYIRSMIARFFWNAMICGDSASLETTLVNSGATTNAQIYLKLARMPWFWPLLRLIGKVKALYTSRLMIRITGGVRHRNGVVFSLSEPAKGWGTYVFSRMKKMFRSH